MTTDQALKNASRLCRNGTTGLLGNWPFSGIQSASPLHYSKRQNGKINYWLKVCRKKHAEETQNA